MNDEKIRVVMVKPGEHAEVTEITNSLQAMQDAVGGYIEPVRFSSCNPRLVLICNEEGKFNGAEPNRALYDDAECQLLDIIYGTFFVCRDCGEDFGSLTDEQAKEMEEKFRYPQVWERCGNHFKMTAGGNVMNREIEIWN